MKQVFNKSNSSLLGGLLAGILIAGLGSGVAFAEYMSFEYDDSTIAEGGAHEVEEFTYEMSAGERVYTPSEHLNLDESLPVGTVRVDAEYNALTMAVNCSFGTAYDATYIDIRPTTVTNDFEIFMQNKDVLLQGLKEGKLVTLPDSYYFDVSVTINPADKDRVFINHEELMRTIEAEANERAADPVN